MFAFILIAGLRAAPAAQFVQVPSLRLATNEVWSRELWAVTETAELHGVASNDLFVAGTTLRFDGRCENDLWALARDSVSVGGAVGDHARLAGKVVTIDGEIGNGAVLAGNTVKLGETSRVRGDVTIFAEDVLALGRIDGRLTVRAPRVTVGGTVDGDVDLMSADPVFQPGTRIGGNLIHGGAQPLVLDPRVTIEGETVVRPVPDTSPTLTARAVLQAASFLASLLLGLAFLMLFPAFAASSVHTLRKEWWKAMLVGSITAGVLPLVAVFALTTIVGIPLGLALLAGGALLALCSQFVIALALGNALMRRGGMWSMADALRSLMIGMFLLYLPGLLPGLGFGFGLFVAMLGSGALLVTLRAAQRPTVVVLPPPLPE